MTKPAKKCWGTRNGAVCQSVSKELCSIATTHTLGDMMRDLLYWELIRGKLSVSFPSRWLIERLLEEIHGEPSKLTYLLISFTNAINRIAPTYDLAGVDEWIVDFFVAEPEIRRYEHSELQLCLQVQITNSPAPVNHGLAPQLLGQIEDVLFEAEKLSAVKENDLVLPDCNDCGSPVSDLVSEVHPFHVWCMPDDEIHSISLERVSNPSSALYWSGKLSSYPWFQSEKWWQVIGCLFPDLSAE